MRGKIRDGKCSSTPRSTSSTAGACGCGRAITRGRPSSPTIRLPSPAGGSNSGRRPPPRRRSRRGEGRQAGQRRRRSARSSRPRACRCNSAAASAPTNDLAAAFDWGVRWAVLGTRALQDPDWVRLAGRPPSRNESSSASTPGTGFVATDGWLISLAGEGHRSRQAGRRCTAGGGRVHRHRHGRHDERAELRRPGRDAGRGATPGHRQRRSLYRANTCGGWWRPGCPAASSAAHCTKEVSI